MRAVRLHAIGDLRVEEIAAPPPPGPGEVTLDIRMAGICGSDLHNFRTGAWITRAPSVAGHEFTGTVSALGDGVAHVSVGDRVVVDSRVVCGTCAECRAGLSQVCARLGFVGEAIDGGFAEGATLPARNVRPAPAGVPDAHLALAEPLAVALHALDRLRVPGGAALVVAGCGTIGALVAVLAATRGHPVRVLDRDADRARHVADLVAGTVVSLDGDWPDAPRWGVDATGAPSVVAALSERLAPGGALCLVGLGHGTFPLDPARLVEREQSLAGCHAFGAEGGDAADLLPSLAPSLDAIVGRVVPLADVPAAYADLIDGTAPGLKTLVMCGTEAR